MITPASSLREVAFVVCTALHEVGVTAVLSGGSAATIWAPDAYQSKDCDFIITLHSKGAKSAAVMADLGYVERGGTYYHRQNRLTVEFPPGPLTVGDEHLRNWTTLSEGRLILHVLSPTDSCRDRLAAFYHWDDLSSLRQAGGHRQAAGS